MRLNGVIKILLIISCMVFAMQEIFAVECESEIDFKIEVTPTVRESYTDRICYGNDYSGHGFFIEKPEKDTVCYREEDCNHYTLNLRVCRPQEENIFESICEGSTYTKHGFNESAGGVYTKHLQTKCGCDSTLTLHLDVISTATVTLFDECCTNVLYNGRGYENIEVKKDTVLESTVIKKGCEAKSQLFITAYEPAYTQLRDTVEKGTHYRKYNFDIIAVDERTTATQTLQTIHGCDSIVNLELYVYHDYLFEQNDSICPGDSVLWQKEYVKTEGGHYKRYKSVYDMDSVYVLHLKFNPVYLMSDSIYINNGDSYTWHGRTITSAGLYVDTLKTVNGCDSICHLKVKLTFELEFPAYFSPNGDGLNDTWVIRNLDGYPDSTVEIYDRYGKRLISYTYRTQPDGWDGIYNGHLMPFDDYWYIVRRQDSDKVYSGHFTLKR